MAVNFKNRYYLFDFQDYEASGGLGDVVLTSNRLKYVIPKREEDGSLVAGKEKHYLNQYNSYVWDRVTGEKVWTAVVAPK